MSPLAFQPPNRASNEPHNYGRARSTWLRALSLGHDVLWFPPLGPGHVDLHNLSVPLGVGKFQEAFEVAADGGMPALTVITGSPQGPLRGMKHTVMECIRRAGGEPWVREDSNAGRFTVEGKENVAAVREGLRRLREEGE